MMNRKLQIIQTAAELFKQKGYNSVSVRDLADNLGIKAASLYNHIASKQEILAHIVLDIAENFTTHIDTLYPQDKLNATEKLEKIIGMHVELSINKTNALACMNNDWSFMEEGDKKAFLKMRNAYEDKFRKIVLMGMKQGEIKACDPEIIVFSLLSTLRTLYLWYPKNKNYDKQTLEADVKQILLNGVIRS